MYIIIYYNLYVGCNAITLYRRGGIFRWRKKCYFSFQYSISSNYHPMYIKKMTTVYFRYFLIATSTTFIGELVYILLILFCFNRA